MQGRKSSPEESLFIYQDPYRELPRSRFYEALEQHLELGWVAVGSVSTSEYAPSRRKAGPSLAPRFASRWSATRSECTVWRVGFCWASTGSERRDPGRMRNSMEV
jgi:hypothetical protein